MKNIYLIIGLALSVSVNAQKGIPGIDYRSCSAAERNNEIIDNNPAIKALMDQQHADALEWTKNHYGEIITDATGKKTILYVIPVVWHVVHNDGPENISRATIENEIAELNKDYQKLNPDWGNAHAAFLGIVADVQVEFRLARKDPDGNCTEGITRTKNVITYAMDESAKTIAPSWNRNGRYYLNIWMGQAIGSGAGGYAYYPGVVPNNRDGVVLRAAQLGNTVTHEVGHWLNLAHCWGSSNTPGDAGNCSSDDGVADTPNTIGQTGCTSTASSCSSVDNVQNYMEYNFCDLMFTNGQKARMHSALNSAVGGRSTLWSPTNRANTGIDDPYVQNPVCILMGTDFTYNKEYLCEGQQVTFNEINTYNGTATQWDWTFNGGTPNVSGAQTPTIDYNTAGVYSASLKAGNGAGWGPLANKFNIITVSSINAQYTLPYADSFENDVDFYNDWWITAPSGSPWEQINTLGYTGSKCVKVDNIFNSANDVTELISPSYNLSSMTVPKLNWKNAFAKKATGSSNDQLIIYSSIDCGSTWQIVTIKTASTMASAPATNSSFVPSGQTQWKDFTQTLSAGLAASSNVRFKFYFKSNGGNNIYIDDINVFGDASTVGIDEVKTVNNFIVYPNPTSESAIVSFNLTTEVKNLRITLKDVLGKEVTNIVNGQSFSAGKYNMSIDQGKKLASGLYFVEFNADNKVKIEKLIVK